MDTQAFSNLIVLIGAGGALGVVIYFVGKALIDGGVKGFTAALKEVNNNPATLNLIEGATKGVDPTVALEILNVAKAAIAQRADLVAEINEVKSLIVKVTDGLPNNAESSPDMPDDPPVASSGLLNVEPKPPEMGVVG